MDTHQDSFLDIELESTKKVSLTRIKRLGNTQKEVFLGWESAYPQEGQGYTFYLDNGRVLRTSPVVKINENPGIVEIETVNSAYHIEYLE